MLRTTALCLVLTLALPLAAQAQAQGQGFSFSIHPSNARDKVQLTLRPEASRNNQDKRDWALSDIEGLPSLSGADGADLRFRIVRPAGALTCTGRKLEGRGEGTCRFGRDAGYFAALERHGVQVQSDWESWQLAAFDVKLAVLEELRRQGYRTPTVSNLVATAIFQIDVPFLRALDAAGYRQRDVQELVPLRIHKITPDYIGAIKVANPRLKLATNDLVTMRIHNVTPQWVGGWAKLGYDLSTDQLASTRIHNVSPDFARSMMAQVRDRPSIDQFIAMRLHGVKPER